VVEKLRDLGDRLVQARTVNHWIYFRSAESRKLFKEKVQRDGFHVRDQDYQDHKYSITVSRKDFAQLHAISDVTDYLVAAAHEYDGDYDGWESEVILEKGNFIKRLKRMFKSKK
jgi:hypothetical protein